MTVTFHSLLNLARAVEDVDNLDLSVFNSLGPHMTCTECDVLTGLFDALGLTKQAKFLFDAHCVGDVEDSEENAPPENEDHAMHLVIGAELIIYYDQQYTAAQLKRTLELEMIEQRR